VRCRQPLLVNTADKMPQSVLLACKFFPMFQADSEPKWPI